MWANSSQIALPQLFIIQYSFVPTHHPACLLAIPFHTFIAAKSPPCLKGGRGDSVSPSPAIPCRRQRLREADSLPYGRKCKPRAVGADIICPPEELAYHPGCPSRRHRAKGSLFRTPQEGRPYGQTDKPNTVGRGLAPAETFGDSLQAER